MQTCEPDQAVQFLSGALSLEKETLFVRHLDECAPCRQLLKHAAGDEKQWHFAGQVLGCSREMPDSTCATAPCGAATGTWPPTGPPADDAAASDETRVDLSFLTPTDDPRMIGRVGGYEISGVIGVGAMGIVLKGFDRPLNRNVALKVLHPVLAHYGAARQRFALEARAMAAVSHEQVVAIYAVDEHARLPFFVMEYAPGGTLENRLAAGGPLGIVEILRVGLQVARGLAAAHRQGLVHRDIKPSNILLERGIERVRVADFGLARVQNEASQTRTGIVVGTPQYMAPEQIRGEPCDARADLFSLGSVLYALCTGHPPFRAESIYAVMHRIAHDDPRPIREQNPAVPDWLEALVGRLLEKEKQRRFQTAEELAEALEEELAHFQNPVGVREPVRAWRARAGRKDPVVRPTQPRRSAPRTPDRVDGKTPRWTFLFKNRWRTLAMTTLSVVGIAVMSFALLTNNDPRPSANDPPGGEASAAVAAVDAASAAQESVPDAGPEVSGVVKAVDAEKNAITVSDREGEKTYSVAQDARIAINGKPANLAGLRAGARITLGAFADPKTTRRLTAVGPNISGVARAIDAEKNTITIADRGDESTFTVTRNANITIDRKPGKLAELPPGARVTLSWFADMKTVRTVEAEGPWWQSVLVKGIDAGNNAVTFDDNDRVAEVAGKTLSLAKGANVVVDGKPAKLEALPPGSFVTLHLLADQKTIGSIDALGRNFQNVLVKGVDPEKSTITFEVERQSAELAGKTFAVASDAFILIDGRAGGKLSEVPAKAFVNVTLSVDQKTIRNIDAQGPAWSGLPVKAVDAAASTITFADDARPEELAGKTFAVAKEAGISIDGKQGTLAGIPAGALVNLTLTADQKTVRNMSAEGAQLGNFFGGLVVQGVDAENSTITVDLPKEGKKTFLVAKNASIEVDGKPGKLAAVPKDASVSLTLSVDQKTARTIQAKGMEAVGVLVKAIDASQNSVTFTDNALPRVFAGKTLVLAKEAEIAIDGKPGNLAAVPAGAAVWLWLSVDQKTILRIHAVGSQIGAFGGAIVQAVDGARSTITVDINGEGEKTFAVAKDAQIRIDGKPGKLADVPNEASIILTLRADQKTVASIEAKSP